MRLILTVLAGLVILAGTVQGMRIPFRNLDDMLEAAAYDEDFLQYLLQQESETEADNGYANYCIAGNLKIMFLSKWAPQ